MNETSGGTRASPIVMHPKMPTEYVPGFMPEESAAIAREALKKWVAVLAKRMAREDHARALQERLQ